MTLRPTRAPGWTVNGAAVGIGAVAGALLATTLGTPRGPVDTVEHLFAALYGARIDDVAIEVRGGEVPVLDGSSKPWLAALDEAGPVERPGRATPPLVVRAPLRIGDARRWIRVEPSPRLELAVTIDYRVLGRSRFAAPLADFARVADARTFGFEADAEAMYAKSRALGATPDNAVVFDRSGRPLRPLRHLDEPARHKWLDLVGDLALLGRPLHARVEAHAAGHALHHALVRALLAAEDRAGDS